MDNLENIELQEKVEINKPKPSKKLLNGLRVIFIIVAVIYASMTVFSSILYIDLLGSRGENAFGLALAVVIVFVIGYGSIVTGVSSILSAAGLILAVKKGKSQGLSKTWNKLFIIFIILPIVTEILFFVALMLLNK